jgi:hypothetical protein
MKPLLGDQGEAGSLLLGGPGVASAAFVSGTPVTAGGGATVARQRFKASPLGPKTSPVRGGGTGPPGSGGDRDGPTVRKRFG